MNKRPTDHELERMIESANHTESYSCADQVMAKIKSGRISMRSRWVILTEELGLRTSWIVAVFALIGVINLTLFILSQGPQWHFLGFGAAGWQVVLLNIPFGWIALGMGLLVF